MQKLGRLVTGTTCGKVKRLWGSDLIAPLLIVIFVANAMTTVAGRTVTLLFAVAALDAPSAAVTALTVDHRPNYDSNKDY